MNSAATESREKSTQAKPDTRAPGGGTKKPLLSLDTVLRRRDAAAKHKAKRAACSINIATVMCSVDAIGALLESCGTVTDMLRNSHETSGDFNGSGTITFT